MATGGFIGAAGAMGAGDRAGPAKRSRSVSSVHAPKVFNVEDGIRPELVKMDPYTPILPYEVLAKNLGRDPKDIVKLDANENSFGPSPTVAEALADAKYLHIYPDPECSSLRQALEEYTTVPSDRLLVGAGADEIIDLLMRLMITPGSGDSIVNFPPTFGMYKFDADVNGAQVINLPRRADDFSISVDKVEELFATAERAPKIVFVTSPNNPDGSTITDADMKRLLALPTLVVLDEAYFEFSDDNRITWVMDYSNLVVLRTFSKWAALAGMRVGYGAFPPEIIRHLWKIKQPYNVSVAGQIAAEASLKDRSNLLDKVDKLKAQRDRFYREIADLDWLKPFPSASNYVLCRVGGGRTALEVKTRLTERGILIRYYKNPGLQDCIRVSMGTPEQMDRLYDALRTM